MEIEVEATRSEKKKRVIAVLEALFVTVLWSSSFVIIKIGLQDIPPLMFAGFRYSIASIILLVLIIAQPKMQLSLRGRSKKWWGMLALYGCTYITATQGTQFLGLYYLPAITLSLLLNLTPMIVLLSAVPMLGERPSRNETVLVAIGLFGVLLYFSSEIQVGFLGVSILGLLIGITSLLANSASALIGRAINRTLDTPPLVVTGIMMSIGSIFLMLLSLTIETMVPLSPTSWIYILWLAVVNTALAFTLWNRAMRVLRAVDMTLINSTMMPQIVILSIAFLGEFPDLLDWIGLILLAISVAAVQYIQTRRLSNSNKANKRKANVL